MSTLNFSYICWSGDFELAGAGNDETPLQKYQRLNCEVRELVEELEAAKEAAAAAAKSAEGSSGDGLAAKAAQEASLSSVALKVSGLQDELGKVRLEETLGEEAIKFMQVRNKR